MVPTTPPGAEVGTSVGAEVVTLGYTGAAAEVGTTLWKSQLIAVKTVFGNSMGYQVLQYTAEVV